MWGAFHRRMKIVVAGLGRLMYGAAGFHWIRVKGRRALPSEAPILCCAPHTSFFDVIVPFCTALAYFPSAVARAENSQIPMAGSKLALYIIINAALCLVVVWCQLKIILIN